ncbi:MAG: hypothetical protein AABY07_01310 [Nanoarchaeota archaeon]
MENITIEISKSVLEKYCEDRVSALKEEIKTLKEKLATAEEDYQKLDHQFSNFINTTGGNARTVDQLDTFIRNLDYHKAYDDCRCSNCDRDW